MNTNQDTEPNGSRKRKSRFEDDPSSTTNLPEPKKLNIDLTAATLRASEISRELAAKISQVSSMIQRDGNKTAQEKKPIYRTLRLDAQGREIDEHGNLVKQEMMPVKTLVANQVAVNALKKKENPYLAHRQHNVPAPPMATSTSASIPISTLPTDTTPTNPSEPAAQATTDPSIPAAGDLAIIDERLPERRRDLRGKKALRFVEEGYYIKEESKLLEKEERKIIAGYSSGRKLLQTTSSSTNNGELTGQEPVENNLPIVPPVHDTVIPSMEWWDEAFLPKEKREQRKISKAAADIDEYSEVNLINQKVFKYIQHPIPIKPLGQLQTISQQAIVPVYLTKKERKKLRRSRRAEREREKRDKLMLGLIPTPEPKFKLSNFMKILGDKAISDPSKIEQKVLQQMQQRILHHEMYNLAHKLTPKERKEKKIKKLNEDVSKGVTVAVFRVTDLSSLKYRFKLDVNAQQMFLSGLVLLCPDEHLNLVVVEGGPRSIRKYIHLMTNRIRWDIVIPNNPSNEELEENEIQMIQQGDEFHYATENHVEAAEENTQMEDNEDNDDEDSDDSDEDSDEEDGDEEEKDGEKKSKPSKTRETNTENQTNEDKTNENDDNDEDDEEEDRESDDSDSDNDDDDDLPRSNGITNPSQGLKPFSHLTTTAFHSTSNTQFLQPGQYLDDSGNIIDPSHKCELLWQGLLPKRMFVGFRFQEAKSSNAARKLLESKNATHYWDMVQKSEVLHQSTTDLLDFI